MKRLTAVGFMLAAALPAMAQDAAEPDWDISRDPAKKSVIAYIPLTTGLALAVRCVDGSLDSVIAGLPTYPQGRPTRPLHIAFGDDPLRETNWNVTTERTVAIADYPSAFARSLRKGGPLKIMIPRGADDGRNLVHNLTLPPSSAAIAETMAACNVPVEDPRDALLPDIDERGLPAGITWARAPRPQYPNTNYATGYAVLTCVADAQGALNQCQIESEHPAKSRFGEASLRAMRVARIASSTEPTGQITPRMIAFRVNFYIPGYEPPGTPRR